MISKIFSIAINGLESDIIEVEVDINAGLPSFTIVGLPDTSVQESKERIRSAFKSSGYKLPTSRITINLAPADIKKSGPSFDLPLAVGLLHHMGYIPESEYIKSGVFIGELSLDGSLREVSSVLPSVIGVKEKGLKYIFLPEDNYFEASVVEGVEIIGVKNIAQLVDILSEKISYIPPEKLQIETLEKSQTLFHDFSQIIGQHQAKRALEIAAAGLHNIIMSGPPGSGKTLLAKTFATILPPLTLDEMIEISKIYSISGLLSKDIPLITHRPFRNVHHTASAVSIIGGGRNAKPGEISLSHKGVLFFDEVLEFPKSVLEVLRQPLEDGTISVSRVHGSYTYPAKFVFLGAMNPCPCGYATDPEKTCICSDIQVQKYRSRLSGPMMDRIDMMIEVPKVKVEDFVANNTNTGEESSAQIRERVLSAHHIQLERFSGTGLTANSQMNNKQIQKYCVLGQEQKQLLEIAVKQMQLSARGYYRILKLSRTIADLEASKDIESHHITEALSYRQIES